MNSRLLTVWILRLAGATEILAFFAVIMPRSWMEISHAWLGMGKMPAGPVLMFLIRQASYTYGMHGVSLWVLASDVTRFRKLVILNGIAYLLACPIFFWIDYTTGMPWYWTAIDSLGCGSFGVAILGLNLIGSENPRA
jgi:hypothetical protein